MYLATILQVQQNEDGTRKYKVHNMKYSKNHDEWVPEAKLMKDQETDPNIRKSLQNGRGARYSVIQKENRSDPDNDIREVRERIDKVELRFSKKNIPIPDEIEYLKQLMNANEKFIWKLGWQIF